MILICVNVQNMSNNKKIIKFTFVVISQNKVLPL